MTKRLGNVSIKDFKGFLKQHGLNHHRTKGGHEVWSKKELTRPVIFQTHIDPIPPFIISNLLRTMGLNRSDLVEYFENIKVKKKH